MRTIFNLFHKVEGSPWRPRVIHRLARQMDVWTLDIRPEEWREVDFPAEVGPTRRLTAHWDANARASAA